MNLETFRSRIREYVRDGAGVLTDAALDGIVRDAVQRYSRGRPLVRVEDVPGDGGYDYPLPDAWSDGLSVLRRVEYPAGAREPVYVETQDRRIYETPGGTVLRFRADSPLANETIRLTYTAPHAVDASGTTVPEADHDAIALLGAALGCEQLASHYGNAGDSTVLADSVEHGGRAATYARRAKRFWSLAKELVPELVDEDEVRAAGTEASIAGDAVYLTHALG